MGFFKNLSRIFRNEKPATTGSIAVDDILLRAILSGSGITKKQAMTIPAVAAAVDYISNSVASMPVKLYKRAKDGSVSEIKDSRTELLNADSGSVLDGYMLKKAMVEDFLLGKGGYAYVKKRMNEVQALVYVPENRVSVMTSNSVMDRQVVLRVEGQEYETFDFVRMLRNSKNGGSGEGLVAEVEKALESAYRAMSFQLMQLKTGGNKRGFLEAKSRLTDPAKEELKKAWKELYSDESEDRVIVLNDGVTFKDSSSTPTELQLNESINTLKAQLKDIFHVYDNDSARTIREAIYPIVVAFETALNAALLMEREKSNRFFRFDMTQINRASVKERYEAYQIAKNTGFLTLNEIRQMEGLNEVEGLDVINVGLGAVLYDTEKHTYYTPNTGETVGGAGEEGGTNGTQKSDPE